MKLIHFFRLSIRKLSLRGIGLALAISTFLTVTNPTGALLAQCSMVCGKMINTSFDDACEILVTPGMFLKGAEKSCPDGKFRVEVLDYNNKLIDYSPVITKKYKDMVLTVMVIDDVSKNSCWGKIKVEDKHGPHIVCKKDTTYCSDTAVLLYPPPFYDNCDTAAWIDLVDEDSEILHCDSHYIKHITRYYKAYDHYGGVSPICTMEILLKRIPLDSIQFPIDRNIANHNYFSCTGNWLKDADGHPHPDVAGVPTIHGFPLWPEFTHYCNTGSTYEDLVLVDLPCKKKILRTWRVIEWWCGKAGIRSLPQIIEILDHDAPIIECNAHYKNITVSVSDQYQCQAEIDLPPAFVYDSCNNESVHVFMHLPGGIVEGNGGKVVLPFGNHTVIYEARDTCYNVSSCTIYITVEDKSPPIPICQNRTVVSLDARGEIIVPARVFDDGSYDGCHLDSMLVRRMDFGAPCMYKDSTFEEYVRFCCEDVGDTVMVVFKVVDAHGNANFCMVQVEVQDKVAPQIHCPYDVTIECTKHIDTTNIAKFGDPKIIDNCYMTLTERRDSSINQCGIGHIDRWFKVTDRQGFVDSCRHRITIEDTDYFTEYDIIWPEDLTIKDSCAAVLDPRNLPDPYGYPRFKDNDCSLIGTTFEDHKFSFTSRNACFKILRKWKVLDWCQTYYDSINQQTVFAEWHYEQVIKVENTKDPILLGGCDTLTRCISTADCLGARFTFSKLAVDDCTTIREMNSSFKVDYYIDGTIDTLFRKDTHALRADLFWPLGTHKIVWSFEDRCGNNTVCEQIIRITNCKLPTAYCLHGISINLSPVDHDGDGTIDDGEAVVWASDVDRGSYHSCGNPVVLSFSRDTNDRSRTYNCDSVGMREVTLYVTDRLTGFQDFCRTFIIVQDNSRICSGRTFGSIAGSLLGPNSKSLENTTVELQGPNGILRQDVSGGFIFNNVPLAENYIIKAIKDINPLEGVTTGDIVAIQRHILDINKFEDPYKLLAADVNADKKVSASDISALRRLILGLDAKFKDATSWKFVDAHYKFPDPTNPWLESIPELYAFQSLPGDMMYTDFVGYKIGDPSFTVFNATAGQSRTDVQFKVVGGKQSETDDQIIRIPIIAGGEQTCVGYQFSLESFGGKFLGIIPALHQIGLNNYHIIQDNVMHVSWNTQQAIAADKGDVLFYIELERYENEAVTSIDIKVDGLLPEAYLEDQSNIVINLEQGGSDLEMQEIHIGYPRPNPFTLSTVIDLQLYRSQEIQYVLSDVQGKVLWTKSEYKLSGKSQLEIRSSDIPSAGIYNIKVMAAEKIKDYKIVMLKN